MTADGTVPSAVRTAARHPADLVPARRATAEGFGDVYATCAITGGVVAAYTGVDAVPERWLRRREAPHGGAGGR